MKSSGPDVTETLGPRGSALWAALHDGAVLSAAGDVLAVEACRLADRLDGLDRVLNGDVDLWMRLRADQGDDARALLVIDSAAGEARQTANTLRLILVTLGVVAASAKPEEGDPLAAIADELAARRTPDPGGAAAAGPHRA